MNVSSIPRPFLLLILDGFGQRNPAPDNAITLAKTPFWNDLLVRYPHTLVDCSGEAVGLPPGQMGNSEVGHMNLGAGRIIYQELTRINRAMADGSLWQNPDLQKLQNQIKKTGGRVHLLGLLSPGGVHSHEDHICRMAQYLLQHDCPVAVHAFLDGRDCPPQSAEHSLTKLSQQLAPYPHGMIASLCGRYFAMDRDKRWDRTQKAFDLLVHGQSTYVYPTALSGLQAAYARGETDEFVQPSLIAASSEYAVTIQPQDIVIFMNFRADRARQLTAALQENFSDFDRGATFSLVGLYTLTEYDKQFPNPVFFPAEEYHNTLGEYFSLQQKTQLRIAETEKYAHVTFFFNGGRELPFPGEERILIPSPKIATYDLKPEMSLPELTKALTTAIDSQKYDFIVCNIANPDMVGHTGNLAATVQAIEAVDQALAQIISTLLQVGGECFITADHGNAEQMFDPTTGQPHTAHTENLVPLVFVGRPAQFNQTVVKLADLAPSLLALLGYPIPPEMTGNIIAQLL